MEVRNAALALTVLNMSPVLASKSTGTSRPRVANQVPDDILHDAKLNLAIEQLPANYSFEIHKTVWSIRKAEAKKGNGAAAIVFFDYRTLFCVLKLTMGNFLLL